MSSFSDERAAELREIFFESAQEILQAMNEEALRLEKEPRDLEALRGLRRAVHTLKGDAAACGYRELCHLAHEFEDVLVGENLAQSAATVETALTAADVFGEMLDAYRTGKPVPSGKALLQLIAKLAQPGPTAKDIPVRSSQAAGRKIATATSREPATKKSVGTKRARGKSEPAATPPAVLTDTGAAPGEPTAEMPARNDTPSWSEQETGAIEAARLKAIPVYVVRLDLDAHCAMLEAALQIIRNILTKSGEILAFAPQETSDLESSRRITAVLASTQPAVELSKKCRVPGIVSAVKMETLPPLGSARWEDNRNMETVGAANQSLDGASAQAGEKSQREALRAEEGGKSANPATENLLRVDSERIDNVLNLVGELIIGRSMFQQTLLEFGKRFPKDPLRTRFADAFAFQSRVLNDLQRSVMKIRMVPVDHS